MNFIELIPVPKLSTFNIGLNSPSEKDMLAYFGHPILGGKYLANGDCGTVNNPSFQALLETRNVGPFRVTGLKPALDSLEEIFSRVKKEVPDLYNQLGTAGMLCARYTKIKKNGKLKIGPNISNHSWGTAIDIKLSGELDPQGSDTTYRGLLVLSTYFNSAGWYWGAAFPTEDAMHFEVSKSLLARWKKAGKI